MDKEGEIIVTSKYTRKSIKIIDSKIKKQKKLLYIFFIIILLINIGVIIYIIINNKKGIINLSNVSNENLLKLKNELSSKISLIDEIIKLKSYGNNLDLNKNLINNNSYEEFNEIIYNKYIQEQNNFCNNQTQFYNKEFEDKIRTANVYFNSKKFEMFIYKKDDVVSNSIKNSNKWEESHTNNLLQVLSYYENKKKYKKRRYIYY